jgi:RNA polymerase sigma-70 factor (ECF subfamily)
VRALGAALAGLPPPQRVVWLLAEVDGLAFAEIAEVVGTSEQAVRGRLFRARTRLAELMRAWR